MEAKLHINILEGTLIVEGNQEFVRTIYNDFKEQLSGQFGKVKIVTDASVAHSVSEQSNDGAAAPKTVRKKRQTTKAPSNQSSPDKKAQAYVPQLQKNLDLSGLRTFYGQYEPKNNAEKILIFVKFLKTELDIDTCTADQIYTCYSTMKERIPKVFLQAIRDTHGRSYGYIDHQGTDEIRLTTVGENHFNHDLKQKEAA